jgi:hypothetical protein
VIPTSTSAATAGLLVTPAVAAEAVSAGLRFEPAGKRVSKRFDEPVTLFTAERG